MFLKMQEIPDFLVPYWENIENAYVSTIKVILRCLRDEQHSIIYYLAGIRWVEKVPYHFSIHILYVSSGILFVF